MAVDASAYYDHLTASRVKAAFDVDVSEAAFASLFERQRVIEFLTSKQKSFFLRREITSSTIPAKAYRVFASEPHARDGLDEIGSCHLRGPMQGIATIAHAAVNDAFRRSGIATAVYDRIVSDMESVGATLWPTSPAKMTDPEFKIWWRRAPVLVFYYPHRQRLGFAARPEYDALLADGYAAGSRRNEGFDAFWSQLKDVARRWLGSQSS